MYNMNTLDINTILARNELSIKIKEFLVHFEENKRDLTIKRGLYLYGCPGGGKTTFIKNLLKELNYDTLLYDAGDIRNKSVIENITKHNMTDTNIMSSFTNTKQHISIIMDEIDGMNNGDKGGLNTLIKLIRPKKTKKQKLEDTTNSPIICISNHHADKKIKELMKVCEVFELPRIERSHIEEIVTQTMPNLDEHCTQYICHNIQGDLRRLSLIISIYNKNKERVCLDALMTILFPKSYNDDTKQITYNLFTHPYTIYQHTDIMNETDRTIVGLLWHENIIDILEKQDKKSSIELYTKLLDNICFADYIDRVTFQKQIWQFNELSSLIKTFHNSKILHDAFQNNIISRQKLSSNNIRFTKVLTKYSTEYNNSLFIQNLCQQIGMDKKDMFVFFKSLYANDNTNIENDITILSENYDITKLDINRITRYLEKHVVESKAKIGNTIGADMDSGGDVAVDESNIEQ